MSEPTEQKATFAPASTMSDAVRDIREIRAISENLVHVVCNVRMYVAESEAFADLLKTLAWLGANIARSNEIAVGDMVAILEGKEFEPVKAGFMECCIQTHDNAVRHACILYEKYDLTMTMAQLMEPRNKDLGDALVAAGSRLLQATKDVASNWGVTRQEMVVELRENDLDDLAVQIMEEEHGTERFN